MGSGPSSSTSDWEGKLFYIPDAKAYPKSGLFEPLDAVMKNEQIKNDFENEVIYSVCSFKGPLLDKFRPTSEMFHRYIIIKTTSYWWSIEKNRIGILLQRGSQEDDVSKNCNGRPRAHKEEWLIKEEEEALSQSSHVKMEDFFQWLENNKESFDQFNLLFRNCKKFGKDTVKFFREKNEKNMKL